MANGGGGGNFPREERLEARLRGGEERKGRKDGRTGVRSRRAQFLFFSNAIGCMRSRMAVPAVALAATQPPVRMGVWARRRGGGQRLARRCMT